MISAFFNIGAAAKHLGMGRTTLDELRKKHPAIFEPMQMVLFDAKRYHIDHLKIIEGVLAGSIAIEKAPDLWNAKRALIGKVK